MTAPLSRPSPDQASSSAPSTPTKPKRTKTTNAAYPFNKAAADAILRTADNVDFWVRRSILAEASCIFEDMLSIPQPPPGALDDDDTKDGLPVICLTEDSQTLDKLLRLCYPIEDPEFTSLDELRPVLEAAMKYMMEEATSLLRARLVKLGHSQPLRAFAIACTLDLTQEAESLVPLAYTAHCAFVDELKDISAGVYYRVSHYMAKCTGPKHSGSGSKKARPVSISASVLEPPPSPKPRCSHSHSHTRTESVAEPIPPELLDSPTADVILRTSDAVDFRLHAQLLSLASPVFRRMLEDRKAERSCDPPDKENGSTCHGVIFVSEDSTTLAALLRHVYPLPRPTPSSFPALKSLLIAAHKYELAPALSSLRPALQSYLPTEALRVFALAHRFNLPDVRAAAARSLLRVSYQELRHRYVEELEEIPAADYFRLLVYHDQCGQAASACVLAHALSYSGASPSSSPSSSPNASPNPGRTHRRSNSSGATETPTASAAPTNANTTSSSGSPPTSTHRRESSHRSERLPAPPADPARDMRACAPAKKRGSTCHVFLDERSAGAWAHFRAHSAPRWWLMYVYKLALVVRNRPWGDGALDRGLWRSALARAAECDACRANFLPGFREYAEGLGAEIERAVAKVKLEIGGSSAPTGNVAKA
ncbi:hypothetical protein C8Q77DRAFT_1154189 [Trametes polyzona]|nr:hypothetical protein C8Q77DRAFT_1154189 [Trametes polyzona]